MQPGASSFAVWIVDRGTFLKRVKVGARMVEPAGTTIRAGRWFFQQEDV